jgi:hypothetical protein
MPSLTAEPINTGLRIAAFLSNLCTAAIFHAAMQQSHCTALAKQGSFTTRGNDAR